MARTCLTIILAAGEGTRMRSRMPKVLHPVAGLAMINHVISAAAAAGGEANAVVVGRDAEKVAETCRLAGQPIEIHLQPERLGTAHATLAARPAIERGYDDILVVFADTPLLRPETLLRLRRGLEMGAAVCVLGFHAEDPTGYGRLIEKDGELVAIREHREASKAELEINFCNGGIMAIDGRRALALLDSIDNKNSKGEFYLTDIVAAARARKFKVVAMEASEDELTGINTRVELARVEAIWQARRRAELMLAGVTMTAPDTVMLAHDTRIGADCLVEPNVVFGPGVEVQDGATIRAFSHLEGCRIASGAIVGPFARLRPGAEIGPSARIGNFCEIKAAAIEEGAKVNHLSYIGDARVGAGANVGAGTITCNYDGVNKHRTDIGAGVFVGSDSILVAPVNIGDGAYVAAGSVITSSVPADALAVGRARQANKEGYAARIRERNSRAKAAKGKKAPAGAH
jgi:bifunctional UDP-N-acetylglucosamine pyrophosphorylase/glucosamine-1-phosphate N-acetyltransferase